MKKLSFVIILIAQWNLAANCFNRADLYLSSRSDPTIESLLLADLLLVNSRFYHGSCKWGRVARCSSPPCLNLCYWFEHDGARLGSTGAASEISAGFAGQPPSSITIYPRYYELGPNANTALGSGQVLYEAATHNGQPVTGTGATILNNLTGATHEEIAFSYSLASIPANTYQYLRVGVAYYEARVNLRHNTGLKNLDMSGVIGAFTGTRVQATDISLNGTSVALNTNVAQGFWVYKGDSLAKVDGTANTVTAVNPIASTSAVPAGSDVITGAFTQPLVVSTHNADVTIIVLLSTNRSFEWVESTTDGYWQGSVGETVQDFAFRGLRTMRQ